MLHTKKVLVIALRRLKVSAGLDPDKTLITHNKIPWPCVVQSLFKEWVNNECDEANPYVNAWLALELEAIAGYVVTNLLYREMVHEVQFLSAALRDLREHGKILYAPKTQEAWEEHCRKEIVEKGIVQNGEAYMCEFNKDGTVIYRGLPLASNIRVTTLEDYLKE
jgi:hypothetical protein